MGLAVDVALLLVGAICLYAGAEMLVTSASRLALGLGLREATVGVTVVAFATTAPEMFVTFLGGFTVGDGISLGGIVGSNFANLGLVLGAAALISPLAVDPDVIKRHLPFMIAAAVLLVVLGMDGMIGTLDGAALLALMVVFTVVLLLRARERTPGVVDEELPASEQLRATDIPGLVFSMGLLLAGSWSLLNGAVSLLRAVGYGQFAIGLTVVAFGTSLPELATSVVSAYRDEAEFSIGNVVGSNIYNVVAVLGLFALVNPFPVPEGTLSFEFPSLLLITAVGASAMLWGRHLTRRDGTVLIGLYLGFVGLLFAGFEGGIGV